MNILGVVFLGLVGLLGAYLFLMVHTEHSSQIKAREYEHKIQIELFDRDFEKAWNGQKLTDPERAKRLEDLEAQQREAKTKAATDTDGTQARERDLRRALDQLSGFQDKKGTP
jgi:hypothetical protein